MRRQVGRAQDLIAKDIQSVWLHGRTPDLCYEGDMLHTWDRFLREKEVDEGKRVSTLERLKLFYNRTVDLDEALLTYGWCGSLTRLAGQGQGVDDVRMSSSVKSSSPLFAIGGQGGE
jgi:hypothetical protein